MSLALFGSLAATLKAARWPVRRKSASVKLCRIAIVKEGWAFSNRNAIAAHSRLVESAVKKRSPIED